jgi:hypothetical protein
LLPPTERYGIAGDVATPNLVPALRHADGELHHFAVTRPTPTEVAEPFSWMLDLAGAEQSAIPSGWQRDALSPWRRVPPKLVGEVRVTNLDLLVMENRPFVSKLADRMSLIYSARRRVHALQAGTIAAPLGGRVAVSPRVR